MEPFYKERSFYTCIIVTLVFLLTGVCFLLFGWADYSWILFVLLPVSLGFALGFMKKRQYMLWAVLITLGGVLAVLAALGLSGLLCIFMAMPFIGGGILIGVIISYFIKRNRKMKDTNKMSVLILPLIPFLVAAPTEHYLKKDKEEIIEVRTERVFSYSAEEVYDAIKSVDTLDAEKPYLMYFDLPIPTKCVLEKEEVGGLRTCYFDAGKSSQADFGKGIIVERITELERAKVLKMDVIDYQVIGRNWLGFKEAIYYFDALSDSTCRMTRITTYTSVLSPRFYWEPLEKLGIRQEHEYVFNNLQNDLER